MKCPHCGNEIDESRFPAGLSFCPYCGDSLPAGEQEEDKLLFCPYCGQELFARTMYCPHCGKELAPAEATASKDRKIKKLYKQWAEHSDLPPEELAALEQAALEAPPVEANQKQNLWVMYLVLAAAVIIIFVGIILLVT
jgi:uncharacterized Zn finger protein (UPF0148 family)